MVTMVTTVKHYHGNSYSYRGKALSSLRLRWVVLIWAIVWIKNYRKDVILLAISITENISENAIFTVNYIAIEHVVQVLSGRIVVHCHSLASLVVLHSSCCSSPAVEGLYCRENSHPGSIVEGKWIRSFVVAHQLKVYHRGQRRAV